MGLNVSPLDPYAAAIQVWLREGKNKTQIVELLAREFGVTTSRDSVRRAIERHNLEEPSISAGENPGVELRGDSAVLTSNAAEDLGDLDQIVRDRGLNPEDWVVEKVTVNEWDGNGGGGEIVKLRQMKVYLKRRMALHFVQPASALKVYEHPKDRKIAKIDKGEPILAVVAGDEQEPYSDPHVKQSFLRYLEKVQPHVFVHLGDIMDLPTISRHKDNPEWAAPVQECIDTAYATLRSYREAAPDTRMFFMIGNHDERLRNELLNRAERMYDIRPARLEDEDEVIAALSPRRLLRLDELAIEFVDPRGGYAHAQVNLSDELGVRHGWLTGENTAGKTLDRLGHSVIVGHTHAQRITQKTIYSLNGAPKILTAAEAGTMSQVASGLGYTVNPNWQSGFVTATIWPDHSFQLDLATYRDGALRWRGESF